MAQRLLRRLCPRCKTVEPATPEELMELSAMALTDGPSATTLLHRANGCEQCGHTGYLGRLAVHEVMVMNDELRVLVLQRASVESITKAAVAGGMQTLKLDAYVKVREGQTTMDELKRVLV